MLSHQPSLEALTRVAREVAPGLRARLILLYGSAARGPHARDLDVGILADSPLDVVAATNAFTRRLGVQDVDIVDLGRAGPLLLMAAARDGVVLYDAGHEYLSLVSFAVRRFADTRKFREAERQAIREFAARTPA